MRECIVCGEQIESGTHHENTTNCIKNINDRVKRLEQINAAYEAAKEKEDEEYGARKRRAPDNY